MARSSRQRRLICLLGATALATLGLAAVSLCKLAPRLVTWAALRDAQGHIPAIAQESGRSPGNILEFRLWGSKHAVEQKLEETSKSLSVEYGSLFRAGYFDHAYVVERIPCQGFTPEALPIWLVILAYVEACGEKFKEEGRPPWSAATIAELLSWIRPVLLSAKAKDSMVSLLIEPYELLPGRKEPAHILKMALLATLTFRDPHHHGKRDRPDPEVETLAKQILSEITPLEWGAVLEHSRHASERVRSGSLLLLCHNPDRETFTERAREALDDPSELVRIAAAGTLAYRGDASGQARLIAGLGNDRWEIRWWCAKSLAQLGGAEALLAVSRQRDQEPDRWVRSEMADMLRRFP